MFDFSIVYKFIDTKTQLVFPDVFWGKADIYTQ